MLGGLLRIVLNELGQGELLSKFDDRVEKHQGDMQRSICKKVSGASTESLKSMQKTASGMLLDGIEEELARRGE